MSDYPFDLVDFITNNTALVKKFLSKNTYSLYVPDVFADKEHYYKNNQIILRAGAPVFEYSDLQKLEYIKCMRDVVYFARKYVKIISIDDGIIPFNLYQFQEELLELYQKHRFVISMQARQTGKTQTTATYLLHFATFTPSKTIAILANKAAQAREILSRIQMSYESLPNFLKQGVTTYNKGSMKFGNRSELFCGASTSSSIRGRSISLVYIDEGAFIPRDMEFYESTYPVISSGKESRIIITSTPNGARGLFHKLWQESVNGINQFKRMEVPWYLVPGRDAAWKAEQIANTSAEQFNQEHGIIFRGSQNSLLSADTLAQLVINKPIDTFGDLKVYAHPINGHEYFVTVDTSRGVGGDFSAFVVFDVTQVPYKVVATYKNNTISPMIYPQVIKTVADKYNGAYVLVEINDIGEQVANILYYEFEYENLLMCYSEKSLQTIGFKNDARIGVRTTTQVKSIGCSSVKTMIETGRLELSDEEMIDEFGTFVPKGKSYEADSGAHDDLVMCCVLFAWATVQQYFIDLTDKDVRKNVRGILEEDLMESLLPFGIIANGFEEFTGIPEARPFGVF
jgi:phage terminase large subunit-like protein